MSSTAPKRIQLQRRLGWRLPPGTIVVSRPSRWGNPFVVGSDGAIFVGLCRGLGAGYYDPRNQRSCDQPLGPLTAEQAVALYRADLTTSLDEGGKDFDELRHAVAALRGHDLACWCPLADEHGGGVPCHADVLLEVANGPLAGSARSGRRR